MLRFLTAGESHGEALVGILEGFPKGVKISRDFINKELQRRQSGYGRGKRMQIEKDQAQIMSGLRAGVSLGSPISFLIKNKDAALSAFSKDHLRSLTVPRPAHADLAGFLKFQDKDLRNVLERASARETAARVVIGALCKQLLGEFNIQMASHTASLGDIEVIRRNVTLSQIKQKTKNSKLNCLDKARERLMIKKIEKARKSGDTLGGIIEIIAEGIPCGLGSFMHWDRRLDARLAYGLMSIPAVKGVEIGLGFQYARHCGSEVHDAIYYSKNKGFYSCTNNAGGILGGISTGAPLVIRIAMKPIATLQKPLDSVDVVTKKAAKAALIRSDVTAIVACGVIAESMTAFILSDLFLERFSSETLSQIKKNYSNFLEAK